MKRLDILVLAGFFVLMGMLLFVPFLMNGCTPAQRSVVRSVVDIIEEVCGDKDTVDQCLGKAQAHRAALRRGDAGAADAAAE
jgi:hypothetical protein